MIRVGIIGAGGNAAGHARYFAACARSRVVAVADIDAERAAALASECGATPVADYRAFLADVDAVVVSSPNFLHREHALAAAAAGRHVYCEKPMGLSGAEAGEIAAAVRAAGVASVVGFSVRFAPNVQGMIRRAREGAVGRLRSVFSRRIVHIDPAQMPAWRRDHGRSGGVLLEINVHELDWMMWLGGEVRRVYARMRCDGDRGARGNDHLWFTLDFAGDAVGTHEGSWHGHAVNFYRGCSGDGGALATDEWGNGLLHTAAGQKRVAVEPDPAFDLRGHFLDCVEGRAEPVADVGWGLKLMTVAEAIFESARTGQAVEPAS